jgi:MFS superfamily sulfate permease-like transporter
MVAICHWLSPRLPGALAAVAAAAFAVHAFGLTSVALLGRVAGGPPQFALPALSAQDILNLAPLALMIALVVMVQTAATARSFPPPGGLPDEDGDFIGLGAANLLSGVAGGFAVNASPPRTAVVAESGGRTQVAGLGAAAIVAALLLFGARLLAPIPQAALAGVLLFVAARIVRVGQMAQVTKATPAEAILILATAGGLVILPIEQGVALGIGLSLLNGLWAGARTRVRPMARIPNTSVWWPASPGQEGEKLAGVAVLTFQAPLNFLNGDGFERDMLAFIEPGAPRIELAVLECAGLLDIDFTAALNLRAVAEAYKKAGVSLAMARLESVAAQAALARLGLSGIIGVDRIFPSVAAAIDALGPKQA